MLSTGWVEIMWCCLCTELDEPRITSFHTCVPYTYTHEIIGGVYWLTGCFYRPRQDWDDNPFPSQMVEELRLRMTTRGTLPSNIRFSPLTTVSLGGFRTFSQSILLPSNQTRTSSCLAFFRSSKSGPVKIHRKFSSLCLFYVSCPLLNLNSKSPHEIERVRLGSRPDQISFQR